MDVNCCIHVGISLYLLTFIGDLRYKMLLMQTCVMHREINSPDISKVHACVFRPVESPMRMLYKHISFQLIAEFINLCYERKRLLWHTWFDQTHVYSFGHNVRTSQRRQYHQCRVDLEGYCLYLQRRKLMYKGTVCTFSVGMPSESNCLYLQRRDQRRTESHFIYFASAPPPQIIEIFNFDSTKLQILQ